MAPTDKDRGGTPKEGRNKGRAKGKDEKIEENNKDKDTPASVMTQCGTCREVIDDRQHASIMCDGACQEWHHIHCEDITEEEFAVLTSGKRNIKWYCNGCTIRVTDLITEEREVDYSGIREKQKAMDRLLKSWEVRVKQLEDKVRDLEKEPTAEELGIPNLKDRVNQLETNSKEGGDADGIRNIQERLDKLEETDQQKIESDIKSKVTSVEVKKMLEDELQKEEKKVKSTVRRTVVEEASKSREKNIIIYRAKEGASHLKAENITHDKNLLEKLIQKCGGGYNEDKIDKMIRLGKKEENKTRPLLISFKELETKKELFRNLKELRGAEEDLKCLSISHDLTPEERADDKELLTEALAKEVSEPEFKFRLRGPPWNRFIARTKKTEKEMEEYKARTEKTD